MPDRREARLARRRPAFEGPQATAPERRAEFGEGGDLELRAEQAGALRPEAGNLGQGGKTAADVRAQLLALADRTGVEQLAQLARDARADRRDGVECPRVEPLESGMGLHRAGRVLVRADPVRVAAAQCEKLGELAQGVSGALVAARHDAHVPRRRRPGVMAAADVSGTRAGRARRRGAGERHAIPRRAPKPRRVAPLVSRE